MCYMASGPHQLGTHFVWLPKTHGYPWVISTPKFNGHCGDPVKATRNESIGTTYPDLHVAKYYRMFKRFSWRQTLVDKRNRVVHLAPNRLTKYRGRWLVRSPRLGASPLHTPGPNNIAVNRGPFHFQGATNLPVIMDAATQAVSTQLGQSRRYLLIASACRRRHCAKGSRPAIWSLSSAHEATFTDLPHACRLLVWLGWVCLYVAHLGAQRQAADALRTQRSCYCHKLRHGLPAD